MKRITIDYIGSDNELSKFLQVVLSHMPNISGVHIEGQTREDVIHSFHRSRVEHIAEATGEDSFRIKKLAAKGRKTT